MSYILFIVYFILGGYLLSRVGFIRKSGLEPKWIVILFALKVAAGVLLGWLSQNYYGHGNDYWDIHNRSLVEYNLLIRKPAEFFTNIFSSYYPGYGSFFGSTGSWWNDLENNIVIKVVAILNVFSRGDFYVNSLLLNVIGFFAPVALYRVFVHQYPKKKIFIIIGCFLLPSTLYFTSGLNKDLFVFLFLCFFCYALFWSLETGFTTRRILTLLVSFIFLMLIRNFVALALVPASLCWYLARRQQWKPVTIGALYLLFLFLVAFSPATSVIRQKQQDFAALPVASTQVKVDSLRPGAAGLARNFPQAVNHGFLTPYPGEFGGFMVLLGIELYLYILLVVLVLISVPWRPSPLTLFCLILTIPLLLLSGYIVPNAGSLVRYRSLYLPFIMVPVLCNLFLYKKYKAREFSS